VEDSQKINRISFGSDMIDFTSPTNAYQPQPEKLMINPEKPVILLDSTAKKEVVEEILENSEDDILDSNEIMKSTQIQEKMNKPLSNLRRQMLERKKEGELESKNENSRDFKGKEIEQIIMKNLGESGVTSKLQKSVEEDLVNLTSGNVVFSSEDEAKAKKSKITELAQLKRTQERISEDETLRKKLLEAQLVMINIQFY
jgi:hypothetical protein